MSAGDLVMLQSGIDAFDNNGEVFHLEPGCAGLVIACNDYDITLLMYGSELFTSTQNIDSFETIK